MTDLERENAELRRQIALLQRRRPDPVHLRVPPDVDEGYGAALAEIANDMNARQNRWIAWDVVAIAAAAILLVFALLFTPAQGATLDLKAEAECVLAAGRV